MKTYLLWLFLVIAWNYGFPSVPPFADVAVAVLLSIMTMGLNKLKRTAIPVKKDN